MTKYKYPFPKIAKTFHFKMYIFLNNWSRIESQMKHKLVRYEKSNSKVQNVETTYEKSGTPNIAF